MKHSHYKKPVEGLKFVDVYRVLQLFGVTDQALGHAIKKLLVAGGRGVKDIGQDVQEAIDTLERWQEMQRETLPDVAVRNDAPKHPAWPEDRAYRWMALQLTGKWFASKNKPYIHDGRYWACASPTDFVLLESGPNDALLDWRDTLIERGADE